MILNNDHLGIRSIDVKYEGATLKTLAVDRLGLINSKNGKKQT